MRLVSVTAAALVALGAAACSDTDDDVVQTPAAGQAPVPVEEARADVATNAAALAYGMTRQQLEDADVLSRDNTDLGDVETLVIDAQGALTHVVVELDGPDDIEVMVPKEQLTSIAQNNAASTDLVTDLTSAQLQALPRFTQAVAPR